MILCASNNPGSVDGKYRVPYIEAVDGYLHAYSTDKGIQWTRNQQHPEDLRCPNCNTAGVK